MAVLLRDLKEGDRVYRYEGLREHVEIVDKVFDDCFYRKTCGVSSGKVREQALTHYYTKPIRWRRALGSLAGFAGPVFGVLLGLVLAIGSVILVGYLFGLGWRLAR
jgi:hypothetical protein